MAIDYPYLVLIVILITLAALEWKYPASSNGFFKVASAVVFVFVAFRAPVICADMWNYTKDAIGRVSMYTYSEDVEPLYKAYRSIFRNFCPYIFPFVFVSSLIIFIPLWVLIIRYSKYKTVSVLCVFLLVQFEIFLGILRQCIGLSFILCAVMYVMDDKKRKWLVYVVLCAIAYFFHHSSVLVAAIFVGCYFLPIKSKTFYIATILVTFMIGMVLRSFDFFSFLRIVEGWGIVDDRFETRYMDEDSRYNENAGRAVGLTMLSRPILAMIIFFFLDEEHRKHWFAKIYFVGVVIMNLFPTLANINRMIISNMLFVTILISWVLESKYYLNLKFRPIVKIAVIGILCAYTVVYARHYIKMGDRSEAWRLHPYYFIWEDYSDHPAITYW